VQPMHSLVPFVRRDLPGTRLESYR